jgi:hypothetical protein
MHPTRLIRTVVDLATQLHVSGAVLLVGRAGIGKSLAWRALVEATSGGEQDTHTAPSHHSTATHGTHTATHAHPNLVHCYPETLMLPSAVLGGAHSGAAAAAGAKMAAAPGSNLEAWLQGLMEGLLPQQVCTHAREEVGEVTAGSSAGVARAASSAPAMASSLGPVPLAAAVNVPAARVQVCTLLPNPSTDTCGVCAYILWPTHIWQYMIYI